MRSIFMFMILALASTAHAGKARLLALQGANVFPQTPATSLVPSSFLGVFPGAPFLVDTQTMFINPAHINSKAQFVTFEGGNQGTTSPTTARAEGGFVRKAGAASLGAYLGHQSSTQMMLRNVFGGTFVMPQNPIEVFYGKDRWGASVGLSNSETAATATSNNKETSLTGRFGTYIGEDEIYGSLELISMAKNDTVNNELSGPVFSGGYEHPFGTLYLVGNLVAGSGSYKVSGTSDNWRTTVLSVGLLDRGLSQSKVDIYYGAYLNYTDFDLRTKSVKGFDIPFVMGLEADLLSWAVLRASITQSFFLGSAKNESNGTNSLSPSNNTTVTAGVGLKIANGLVADATLGAGTTGDINATATMANASLTYSF